LVGSLISKQLRLHRLNNPILFQGKNFMQMKLCDRFHTDIFLRNGLTAKIDSDISRSCSVALKPYMLTGGNLSNAI